MFILQVYDGTTLIKTEKIEPGASAISMLGIDSNIVIFDLKMILVTKIAMPDSQRYP